MRRSLLNKRILPKPLRQALVLITLLLLPSAAWGQGTQNYYLVVGGNKDALDSKEYTISASTNGITLPEDGSVSFSYNTENSTGTLTLKNATITNFGDYQQALIISDQVGKLIIDLQGQNSITNDLKDCVLSSNSATTVEFTSTTQDGSLLLETDQESNLGVIGALVTIDSYKNGLEPRIITYRYEPPSWTNATKAVISVSYGLTIANVEVTSENLNTETGAITGLDNVTFTPATNTLKLNNAVISGSIYTTLESLIIDITNTNSIATSGSKNGIVSTTNTGTLTFTGTGSLEISSDCSVIRGFTAIEGLNLETKTPYEIYNNGYYRLKDKAAADSTGVKWLKVIQQATYPLWIAGTQVTEVNASNITGPGITVSGSTEEGGGISFSNTDNQLTLKNVTIDYSNTFADPIISSIDNLKVKLIGINKINIADISYCGFKYTGTNGTLTFVNPTRFSEIGLLEITYQASQAPFISYSNLCSGYTITDFDNFMDGGSNDSNYTPANSGWVKSLASNSFVKVRYIELYDLWIGGARITSANLTGNGYQNYDPGQSSIKYSGATSSARIVSNLPELTIILSGENSLNVTDGTDPAISFTASGKTPTGKLVFTKDKNTTSTINRMTIDCANGAIVGFSEVTTDDPLKPAPATWDNSTTKVVISDEVFYDLWVGGVQVTSGNASNIIGDQSSQHTAVFDASGSILTLNGLQIFNSTSSPSFIESGLENLTVILSGENKFMKGGDVTTSYGFKVQGDKTRKITFTTSNNGSINIDTNAENAVVGFTNVTYNDGLAPYMWNSKYYIAPVTLVKPEFICNYDEEDSSKLLSVSIDSHATSTIGSNSEIVTILAYDVIYTVDGGSETAYSESEPITISGPCTLTAKTIVGNTSSEVATGKYFGAKQEVFTMAIGESLADLDWCTPSFNAETEYLICKFISESSIFNYDVDDSSKPISTKASGTGTINIKLSYNDRMVTQILNNIDSPIATLTINVGEPLNSVFEGENTFGGLYSETNIQVPEGMKAYVITGIDEEKGTVITSPVDFIPAGVPVMLENEGEAKAITHVPYTDPATVPSNNKLYYSNPNTPAKSSATDKWYVIYNNKFVKVTTGTEVRGGKCYLNLNSTPSSGTRSYYDIDGSDGTTALREVKSEGVKGEKWNDGEWYTLQGQRVTKPTKPGLYILNGKKVVIK